MENLSNLLEQLAAKLGVAIDVLWAALLRQAVLAGISNLIFIIATGTTVYLMVKWYRAIQKNRTDEIVYVPFGICAVFIAIMAIYCIDQIPMTLAAFFNPEYWALKTILQ
jgi:hypothetical protein